MPKFPKTWCKRSPFSAASLLSRVLLHPSVVAEQQACFPEFRSTPCTSLDPERMQLGLEGSWSRALLGGCGGRHIASAQSVPSLADATAVPRVSANATTSAGAEKLEHRPHRAARECSVAAGQGKDNGSFRLYTPLKSLWQSKFKSRDCPIVGAGT